MPLEWVSSRSKHTSTLPPWASAYFWNALLLGHYPIPTHPTHSNNPWKKARATHEKPTSTQKIYLHGGSCDLSWTNSTELPAQIICAIWAKHSLINPRNHSKTIKWTNQIHQVAKFYSLQTTKSLPMLLESSYGIKTHDSVTTQLILLAPSFPLHPQQQQSKTHLRIKIHTYVRTYVHVENQIKILRIICYTLSKIKSNGIFFKEFYDEGGDCP